MRAHKLNLAVALAVFGLLWALGASATFWFGEVAIDAAAINSLLASMGVHPLHIPVVSLFEILPLTVPVLMAAAVRLRESE